MKKTTKIYKKLVALVLVGVLTFAFAGCGASTIDGSKSEKSKDSKKELDTVKVAVMTGDVTAWTAAVGEEKGIYEKYGLKLDVSEFAMGINTLDAVTTDQADIGFVADFAGINRLGNTEGEPTFRIFSRLAQVVDYRIYAKDDIKTIEDLKGKKVGLIKGTIYEYLNSVALQSVGLTPDDVDIQAYESNQDGLASIQSGKLDAMWSGGMASAKLEKMDGISLLKTQEELGAISSWIYVANEKFLKDNQDVVERYLKATEEIYDIIESDLDAAGKIVEDKTSMPKDDFLALIANYKLGIDFEDGALETLDKVNSWAHENGFFTKEYDVRDYIDASAVKNVYPDKVSDQI